MTTPEVTVVPMPTDRIGPWLDAVMRVYHQERVQAGDTDQQATENVASSLDEHFPGRVPGPSELLYDVLASGAIAGYLWIAPRSVSSPLDWWVFDIEIAEAYRSRGVGRATMLLAESEARRHGARSLGLNVFGHNTIARALYESLDYVTTAVQMRKEL